LDETGTPIPLREQGRKQVVLISTRVKKEMIEAGKSISLYIL
jgi:hypothetical protein